jgi:hypothetical protein
MLLTIAMAAVVALERQEVDGVAGCVAAGASSRQQLARLRSVHCVWRDGGRCRGPC